MILKEELIAQIKRTLGDDVHGSIRELLKELENMGGITVFWALIPETILDYRI